MSIITFPNTGQILCLPGVAPREPVTQFEAGVSILLLPDYLTPPPSVQSV